MIEPQLATLEARQRELDERQREVDARAGRHRVLEQQLSRRATKLAAAETALSHRARDVRSAERMAETLHEREHAFEERRTELARLTTELEERGNWLTAALARVDERERVLQDREREAERVLQRERELDEREAQLNDRDRQLTQATEELVAWRRRVREQEVRLQVDTESTEPAHAE